MAQHLRASTRAERLFSSLPRWSCRFIPRVAALCSGRACSQLTFTAVTKSAFSPFPQEVSSVLFISSSEIPSLLISLRLRDVSVVVIVLLLHLLGPGRVPSAFSTDNCLFEKYPEICSITVPGYKQMILTVTHFQSLILHTQSGWWIGLEL